jgi:hypothetical protein
MKTVDPMVGHSSLGEEPVTSDETMLVSSSSGCLSLSMGFDLVWRLEIVEEESFVSWLYEETTVACGSWIRFGDGVGGNTYKDDCTDGQNI